MAARLTTQGWLTLTDPEDTRIFLAVYRDPAHPGLLVSVDEQGSLLWDGRREMNPFQLVEAGVCLYVARPLAEFLNSLISRNDGTAVTENQGDTDGPADHPRADSRPDRNPPDSTPHSLTDDRPGGDP